MKSRKQHYTQEVCAAKAGISVRTGRDIERGKRTSIKDKERDWRTREDPLASVWDTLLAPMLKAKPMLKAMTLLEFLQSTYPGEYEDTLLRTMQRRVKQWRALEGPNKEVMFRQQHEAGRLGLSDFTHLKKTTITIAGQVFKHLLYHFRLAFSHWSYMKVIEGGESYTALAEGLQEGLQRLGGAPLEHRTDSLSAAYKNLGKTGQHDMTSRYEALCRHYAMTGTRNNPGISHENGSIESPHGHLKRRIEQALLLRGSCDFESTAAYQSFIDQVVQQHNQRNATAIDIERQALQPLPEHPGVDYTEVSAVVTSSSTIDVRRATYTVPSRLQGETLRVRLYHDRLICYLGTVHVVTLKRVYAKGNQRARQVDYRHVIHSLVKKPQAYRCSVLRDELLPSLGYKVIWCYVDQALDPRSACKYIVGLLHLAATQDCERALAEVVLEAIDHGRLPTLTQLQQQFRRQPTEQLPQVQVEQHALAHYNHLIPQLAMEVTHA